MDIIFEIGLCFLPFENLFVAPSMGWATITPIIFLVYLLFNIKYVINSIKKYKSIYIFIALGMVLSAINYIFVGIEIKNLINSLISLGFGIIDFLSIDIFFRQKKNNIDKSLKMILIVYMISFLIGWLQFITIKFNLELLKQFFIEIEKRSYIQVGRAQFTFTEPSFIGMHLFGILLPIYFYTRKKSVLTVIITFIISSIIFSSSIRVLIDIIAVIGILCIVYFVKNIHNKKILVMAIIICIAGILSIMTLYNTNIRIKNIIDNGIYGDASLASRYFRTNASIKGSIKDHRILIGYGIGNAIVPLRSGLEEALKEYKSTYVSEIEQLANQKFTDDSVSFCLYTRLISEFGIIFLIVMVVYLYRTSRKSNNFWLKNYIWILFYIYIQFESYAFYTIWLYIVLLQLDIENKEKKE